MYDIYRVVCFTRNQSGQDAATTFSEKTEADAINTYHTKCALYGKDKSTKCATVMLFDTDGGLLRKENFIHEDVATASEE